MSFSGIEVTMASSSEHGPGTCYLPADEDALMECEKSDSVADYRTLTYCDYGDPVAWLYEVVVDGEAQRHVVPIDTVPDDPQDAWHDSVTVRASRPLEYADDEGN